MQAVLEKQSYILLSRSDFESLMRLDPANASLQNSLGQLENTIQEAGAEVEIELSDLLLDMCPIKQVFYIFKLCLIVVQFLLRLTKAVLFWV
jgi:exocyst complex component 4